MRNNPIKKEKKKINIKININKKIHSILFFFFYSASTNPVTNQGSRWIAEPSSSLISPLIKLPVL